MLSVWSTTGLDSISGFDLSCYVICQRKHGLLLKAETIIQRMKTASLQTYEGMLPNSDESSVMSEVLRTCCPVLTGPGPWPPSQV